MGDGGNIEIECCQFMLERFCRVIETRDRQHARNRDFAETAKIPKGMDRRIIIGGNPGVEKLSGRQHEQHLRVRQDRPEGARSSWIQPACVQAARRGGP
jgi:hypothetical protein